MCALIVDLSPSVCLSVCLSVCFLCLSVCMSVFLIFTLIKYNLSENVSFLDLIPEKNQFSLMLIFGKHLLEFDVTVFDAFLFILWVSPGLFVHLTFV